MKREGNLANSLHDLGISQASSGMKPEELQLKTILKGKLFVNLYERGRSAVPFSHSLLIPPLSNVDPLAFRESST